MSTHTDVALSFTVDGVEYACQLVDPTLIRPWAGEGATVVVACGDRVTEPPESPENGSITGTAYADYSDTGISVGLDAALGQTVDIVWTEQVSTDRQRIWTGKGQVRPMTRAFTAARNSRHDIDIVLTEETGNTYSDTPAGG